MTPGELQGLLARMTFPPGWTVTFEHRTLTYEGAAFPNTQFVIEMDVPDSYHPERTALLRMLSPVPPWLFDPQTSERMMADWVRTQCHLRAIHEVDEWVRLDGQLLHDPHAATSSAW